MPYPIKLVVINFNIWADNGQCVSFVQAQGFEDYRGNAYEWKKYINTEIGQLGDVVVLNEGKLGHLAYVIGVENGYQLVEQNYEGKYKISYRTIPFDYPLIVGFIHK